MRTGSEGVHLIILAKPRGAGCLVCSAGFCFAGWTIIMFYIIKL